MPAYFSIDIEFDRKTLDYTTVDELNFYMRHAGLVFRKACWGAEGLSEKEVISRNQKLLENNFVLADGQDHSEGYIQSEYDFEGFSGVRGYFLNKYPGIGGFVYELVIPEEEVLGDEPYTVKKEAAERILSLIMGIWHMPSVVTVQTATELKGEIVSASDFGKWKLPAANPYALVSEIQLKSIDTEGFDVRKFHIGGIILTNKRYMFV